MCVCVWGGGGSAILGRTRFISTLVFVLRTLYNIVRTIGVWIVLTSRGNLRREELKQHLLDRVDLVGCTRVLHIQVSQGKKEKGRSPSGKNGDAR